MHGIQMWNVRNILVEGVRFYQLRGDGIFVMGDGGITENVMATHCCFFDLEDCPDLSKYNFNDKVSYITVFSTNRPGFFWARNSIQNGQFVAGHWERPRANGTPVNTIVVVSPPLPPHYSADTLIDARTIPSCPNDKIAQFEFVKNKMEGLLVSNPTNEDIGYPQAFYDGWRDYYWKPVNGKKMTACGTFVRFSIYDGQSGWPWGNDSHDDEYDWNLTIVPDPDFGYIIDNVKAITGTTEEWQTARINGREMLAIQGEITPDESLYDNVWFPNIGHEKSTTNVVTRHVGVYGPWVMDMHHNGRPEIHPCEVIWWRDESNNKDEYTILGIQDDSNRYDEAGDFVFDQDFGLGWKPWASPPITSTFKIPFEYNGQFTDHLVVDIEELKTRNVVTPTFANSGDSDDGNNHILRFNQIRPKVESAIKPSNILVEVRENQALGSNLGVSFVDVCKKPDGSIIGYIQLFTAFGKNVNGDEGYHVLKVTLNHPTRKIPTEKIKLQ